MKALTTVLSVRCGLGEKERGWACEVHIRGKRRPEGVAGGRIREPTLDFYFGGTVREEGRAVGAVAVPRTFPARPWSEGQKVFSSRGGDVKEFESGRK